MENHDRILRKAVGKLIEVLHGEYSDSKDLAVVQLALLGRKAVPYILSFLEKEGDLERDLIEHEKIPGALHAHYPIIPERVQKFRQQFEKKWGRRIGEINTESWIRKEAVNRALEALAIIGDPRAIPVLKKLPTHKREEEDRPLFANVKETIEKMQELSP